MSALKLYSCVTPNGYKVSILLELLGLDYDVQKINFKSKEQKEPWFVKLNPNGRVPTLVDSSHDITISETAAIMQYLVDTYDKDYKYSYKVGTKEYYKQLELLYFQMAGIGPSQGQFSHFKFFATEKIPYGIERYGDETKRLYSVLEEYLKRNEANGRFLVGTHYSIADIAVFPWANTLSNFEVDISQWPLLKEWFDNLKALPAVQKGLTIPDVSPYAKAT